MTHIELDIRPRSLDRHLDRDLDALHESYVDAVNRAVTDDDLPRAEEIAATYEAEVLDLVAARASRRSAA